MSFAVIYESAPGTLTKSKLWMACLMDGSRVILSTERFVDSKLAAYNDLREKIMDLSHNIDDNPPKEEPLEATQTLFDVVTELQRRNARHKRRDKRLGDFSCAQAANHLIEEAVEIQDEMLKSYDKPKRVEEIGDALAVLYDLITRQNFTLEEVEQAQIKKLAETFED